MKYDTIGLGYAEIRRPDPRLAAMILEGLEGCGSVVNVGAGAGSYEPEDRAVVAVEPSSLMIEQRPPATAPVITAVAEALPLPDRSMDGAMSVLSIQHWSDWRGGLQELARVARRRVVTVTIDTDVLGTHWMFRDYAPEVLDAHADMFPTTNEIARAIRGSRTVAWPVPADVTDRFMAAIWARPELFLDPTVQRASSAWHLIPESAKQRAISRLADDLASGAWDARYGDLRRRAELDVGIRMVIAEMA